MKVSSEHVCACRADEYASLMIVVRSLWILLFIVAISGATKVNSVEDFAGNT